MTDYTLEFGIINEEFNLHNFNVNEFVINFSESYSNKIIDKIDISNLLQLDSYDLISIVLRKKSNIFIQFDENSSKKFLDILYLRVETTNSILRSLGNINYLILTKTISTVIRLAEYYFVRLSLLFMGIS